ncbi:hypothetical protein CI109_101104 [Kwoniella shandongensis]|uniref:Fe2OG dioxygenase domain-containing protein n=1 Tax=Kwoniella shandongensis TaxID=1734106 RepID=A0AAJ8LH23_9TREE
MRLSAILPGEAFDNVDPEPDETSKGDPVDIDEQDLRFRVTALWLLYDKRTREAREYVLCRARKVRAEGERQTHIEESQRKLDHNSNQELLEESEEEQEQIEWDRVGVVNPPDRNEDSIGSAIVTDCRGKKRESAKRRSQVEAQAKAKVKVKGKGGLLESLAPQAPILDNLSSEVEGHTCEVEQGPSKRPKRAPQKVKAEPLPRPKADYSGGWTIQPVPTDFASFLRMDHPPEILNAPRPARQATPTEYEIGVRLSEAIAPGTRKVAKKKKRQLEEPSNPKRAQVRASARKKDEMEVVPLPVESWMHRGIKSSTFSAVLRIIAGLGKPTVPPCKQTVQAPRARPPVWAESRQELCEALPYYRSFQSGLYMHVRVAFGYLLEAFPAPRDTWAHNGRVVISHGGGQCVQTRNLDGTPGPATLHADQSRSDARVDTLLNAHERRTPIILIAGAGYEFLPWKLSCAYVVLGWYWISAAWVEAEPVGKGIKPPLGRDYFHRYKIRFDWVDSQGVPWWDNDGQRRIISGFEAGSREDSPLTPCPEDRMPSTGLTLLNYRSTGSNSGPSAVPQTTGYAMTQVGSQATSIPRPRNSLSRHSVAPERPSLPPSPSPIKDIMPLVNHTGLLTPPITPPDRTTNVSLPKPEIVPHAEIKRESDPIFGSRTRPLPGEGVLNYDLPVATSFDLENHEPLTTSSFTCPTCTKPNPQVYQEGEICLSLSCPAFFMLPTHLGLLPIPPGFQLTLSPTFLEPCATPSAVRKVPYDVVPPEPISRVPDADASGVGGRTLWRGWVCKRCGRANCRYRWEVWECRSCGNTLGPLDPNNVVSPSSLEPTIPTFLGNAHMNVSQGVTGSVTKVDSIRATIVIYDLANVGKVYHIMHEKLDLADGLLDQYQREAARGGYFQRRALKAVSQSWSMRQDIVPNVKGPLLAQHFAVNSGASYKYNVDTVSFPFENSPSCVIHALDLITKRVESVLGEQVPFNECLSVMYREGQKMSWHDDGEQGLGPVVASLSLGSPAIMSFRRKQPRIEPNRGFYTGFSSARVSPPIALSITLSHGDIMIMQGREIQKTFDHRVIPQGFRIAATARTIGIP